MSFFYQGAKNMTKCAAVDTALLNISTVYVCLACSSSSVSFSQPIPVNNNAKYIKLNNIGVIFTSEQAMIQLFCE